MNMTRSKARPGSEPLSLTKWLKFPLLALVAISLVSNLLMLAGPLFMLQIYDRVLASKSLPTLTILTLLIAAIYAFYAALEVMRGRMAVRAANLIDERMADGLFAAAIQLKLSPTGGALDPVREGDVFRTFFAGSGPLALLDLPWMPIYLALVFLMHPLLGWLALAGAVTIVSLAVINELVARKPSIQANRALSERQRYIDDARLSAEAIYGMGMMADVQRRRRVLNDALLDVQRQASDRAGFFSSLIKSLRFLLQSCVLAVGAYLVIEGHLTGGLMIAASIITSRALAPVDQIVGQWRAFIGARQAYQRIRKILPAIAHGERETLLPLPTQSLIVQQLAVGPMGSGMPIVSGIHFELRAGDGLAILGVTGSGKSSLARGLVGVWPCLAGTLRLDGVLLAHYDPSQLQAIIGYLPQQVELFSGTVAENIARFQHGFTSEAVVKAAKAASAHELISALPNGYDTNIGEHGQLLSAGQRQRIGLARALYGEPFLLVLDEPNSNLDAEGDAALAEAVQKARNRGAIVVVIAHRPSAISNVDKVLLLQKGHQTAFGAKKEVLDTLAQNAGDNVRTMRAAP